MHHNTAQDGSIKFHCRHIDCQWNSNELPLCPELSDLLQKLDTFRTKLHEQNFIGIYENGIGYGNLSHRFQNDFIITASATGGARQLGIDGYCMVTEVDVNNNTVQSMGALPASSETMSHASVYANSSKAQCVLHIHNKTLFDMLKKKNALSTAENISYGTVEMALAISEIVKNNPNEAIICMQGHAEGILIYGISISHVQAQLAFLCEEAYQELHRQQHETEKKQNHSEYDDKCNMACKHCPKGEKHD